MKFCFETFFARYYIIQLWLVVTVNGVPNVLFLVSDDLRPFLGAYGDPIAVTPAIDSIAANGVVFDRAYCQQALCGPSRTSFLTSRRPDTTRLYDFYSYWREAAGNFTTLPQHLKENGYHTVSAGKIFHPDIASNYTDDYPYSWSEVPHRPSTEKFMNSKVCLGEDEKLHENLVCPVDVEAQPEGTLPDLQSADFAVHFLNRWSFNATKKPFFLGVGFHKPHIPLKFPKKYLDFYPLESIPLAPKRKIPRGLPKVAWNPWTDIRKREDVQALHPPFPFGPLPDDFQRLVKQSYYAAITFMDDQVGRVLTALNENGFRNNTIVILIGDHGWSLGEHQEWAKYSNFEVAVKVPFIISVPGLTDLSSNAKEQFTTSSQIVELVDIFPTINELVGLDPIAPCPRNSSRTVLCTEGQSLLPFIERAVNLVRPSRKRKGKNLAFSQFPRPSFYPQKDSDEPRLKNIKIMGYSVRTNRYRYTEWVAFDPNTFTRNWTRLYAEELYRHAKSDPVGENVNLAGDPKFTLVKKLLSRKLRRGWRGKISK